VIAVKSLGTRLALVISSVLLVLVLLAGVLIERQLTQAIHHEEVDQAKAHAQTLLASLRILMLNGQGALAREWLDSMHGAPGIVDIEVLRRNGREAFTDLSTLDKVNDFLGEPVFEREPVPPHHMNLPDGGAFSQALNGHVALDLRFREEMTVLQPIEVETECLTCHGYETNSLRGVLKLSLSREQGLKRIQAMRTSLWAIAALLVLIIGITMLMVLRVSVLKPINRLKDAIMRVGAGERQVELPQSRDELGQVATVFNKMQLELIANETRIRAVSENAFDAIVTADERGVIDTANQAVEKMFGYRPDELIGRNVSVLMPEPYRDEHDGYIDKYLLTGKGRLINNRAEVVGQRKDGTTFPLEIALSEMFIGEQRYFVAVARDITENKRQTAALQHQALHDSLTELPNRTLLSDRIRQSILLAQREHHQLALLVMDLDRFKEINDTLGHQYGDQVLQQVSERMRHALRESDTIARLGGDEFAILLPNTGLNQAKAIADKLLRVTEDPIEIGAQMLHVGGSIGITLYPQHGEDEVTLLQRADVAMYVAKREHLGSAVYDPSSDQHSLRNLALLGELRGAIERDQLLLYFQPKIDLRTGKVYGVESLVRWQHPQHGLMLPDEFVPLAEQTGLIAPLSLWALKSSLNVCNEYQCAQLNLDVAVNLSVRNLHDPRFPNKVARLIDETGTDPRHLRLEITETAIMADPGRALDVLNRLSVMGVKLSIDDFGTGYSSLAHLKQMPVDELKIDKEFVMGMLEDESDAVIVRSIIDLAHNIGIKVVAEGVESKALYERLKEMGCDSVQGYYMCTPVPVDELMEWVRNSSWRP
jgi:diguanylate cyclase (GGDEF)-like protein/PAS domain S-box-containing protein